MTDESESASTTADVDGEPAGEDDPRGSDRASGDDPASAGAEPAPAETVDDAPLDVEDPGEIDPAELTVEERSLHPRIRVLWIVRSIVVALVTGGVLYALDAYLLEVGPALPIGAAVALAVLGVVHALLRYRIWRYEVREDALYLERGVVTRVRTVVPFVRIQHVDTRRGPVERATGLATSVVYTAGSRGADVAIPGLEADRAEDMQHRLKRLAIASEADTAV